MTAKRNKAARKRGLFRATHSQQLIESLHSKWAEDTNNMTPGKAVFLYSPQFENYRYPPEHPFKTERAVMTRKLLNSMNLLSGDNVSEVAPEPAERDVIEKFHSPRYIDALIAAARGHFSIESVRMGIGTGDCPVFKDMYDYAVLACGASLKGAGMILSGETQAAFNPSGGYHHAGPERASGFCYINDVVLACMALAEEGKRVFYLDIDLHHGDGVQNAFYNRKDVMTISFHESGKHQFPGTGFEDEIGIGEGKGYSVNVPLPPGTYDEIYMKAFKSIALPLRDAYQPDVIVMELGMDSLAGDPIGNLALTNNVHADIIDLMLEFKKPILATGGGGYNVDITVRGWALSWSVLSGAADADDMGVGLGGVMLETAEWPGALRDTALTPDDERRKAVDPTVEAAVEDVKTTLFKIHGL